MTNFLFGTQKTPSRGVKGPATSPRIQTSANGVARSFGYGQARMSGNLLWYGAFQAVPTYQSLASGGGKGGGSSGGAVQNGWNYYASAIWGLCEGPITGVLQAWENKSPVALGQGTPLKSSPTITDAANETFTLFDGDYQQQPWAWLVSEEPADAQNFRGIAYEAATDLNLGTSPELPNMTFEVRFAITGAIAETATLPSTGAPTVVAQYYDFDYGAVGHAVIPAAAPYQLSGAPDALYAASPTAPALGTEAEWIASAAFGVVWDSGATGSRVPGTALTQVSGTPSAGQYQVVPILQSCDINFAAADAGQPIILIAAAIPPGVYYTTDTTATLSAGSAAVTDLGSMTGIAAGARVGGTGIPPFTFVQSLSGGAATGTTSAGSNVVSNVTGSYAAPPGTGITDSAGAFAAGTTLVSNVPSSITLSADAALTVTAAALTIAGQINDSNVQWALGASSSTIIGLSAVEAAQFAPGTAVLGIETGAYAVVEAVTGPSGGTYTAVLDRYVGLAGGDVFDTTTAITGDLAIGSNLVTSPSSFAGVTASALSIADTFGALTPGTTITAVTQGGMTLSHTAGSSVGSDVLTFSFEMTLSQGATESGTGVALTFIGEQLEQTLAVPSQGQYNVTVSSAAGYGTYTFAGADAGKTVLILDSADANPADVLTDFLTNPYYGLTQFPADRIGDLSTYRAYCQAAGLVVSPVVSTQTAANSFLQDLMQATNSEIVWSGGLLTVVPYGDTALVANGATYTPPSAPLYLLGDDDFLVDNEGTNPKSVSTASSPDPVTITRLDIADQENDIKIEYLDRGNQYNPTIIEAQDNAAIELFGLKSNGSKQLHLFRDFEAALTSAQLMLGRQQVLRTFSFTLGREYVLLDPMDIVAITDVNAGLNDQWVRIKEITENDDRSLSITAEEYLEGTGAAPLYPHQRPSGFVPNYNLAAPAALAPIFFDAPVQVGNVLGMETILCTNGSGANWGGCDIWISQDGVTFKYAGTLMGGTCMGVLTANLPIGSDPDTSDTLSVDLTESEGSLVSGTQADADQGYTLCLVDSELVTYEQAALTGQYKYNLGKNGSTPGYLRRGFFGTTIASHTTGAKFARLREGSYFSIGYDNADIGQTIYVKLLSFNPYGGGKTTLDAATSYSHTLSAPPVASSGLLAQVIATPDIQLNAATGQTTVTSQAGGAIASGSLTSILSAAYTSIGQTLQISGSIGLNETGGTVTCLVSIIRDGSAVYSPAPVLVPATVSAANTTIMVPFNFTDTPAAGAHTYTIKAEANGADMNWTSAELVVTEIKR